VNAALPAPRGAAAISPQLQRVWRVAVITAACACALVLAARLLPQGLPPGVALFGAVVGSLNGLLAMGLVLIYQANRIINFAQAALGSVGLMLAFELVYNLSWPYLVAVPIGVVASALLAGGAELAVMRRFSSAPRLITTLGTIGLANVVLFLQLIVVVLFEAGSDKFAAGTTRFPSPFGGKAFVLSYVVFSWNVVVALIVVPAILVGLTLFFRRSRYGLGMRGAAENSDRASLLGIPVGRLSTGFWMLAGALAGVGTLLRAPITGYSFSNLSGTGFLAVILTAAVVGRFQSLTRTFLAAVGIGALDQVVLTNWPQNAQALSGIHLGIVVIALLLTRQKARATWAEVSSWRAFREVRPIPRELLRFPEVRLGRVVAPVLLLGAALCLPLVIRDIAVLRLVTVMGIWAIAALSLVILTGWAGQISLGQWALVGVGAATAGRLLSETSQPSLIIVLVACAAVGALVAGALGLPALRLRGIYLAVITFAFADAAWSWLFNLDVVQPGAAGIVRPGLLHSEQSVFYVVAGLLGLCVVITANLRRSRFGRALIAARDNSQATESFGVNVLRARVAAFVISGAMAGLAGGLYTLVNQSFIYKDFDPPQSLLVFAVAVIGGLGSIVGALFGTVYIVGAGHFLPSWGTFLATGTGMLFFLMVFPGGLGQIVYGWRDRLLRRVALRRGVESPSILADLGGADLRAAAEPPPGPPGPEPPGTLSPPVATTPLPAASPAGRP
jgi:branched-chain amino acid transport system permease protein